MSIASFLLIMEFMGDRTSPACAQLGEKEVRVEAGGHGGTSKEATLTAKGGGGDERGEGRRIDKEWVEQRSIEEDKRRRRQV